MQERDIAERPAGGGRRGERERQSDLQVERQCALAAPDGPANQLQPFGCSPAAR
jgi:hypothetical protein